MEHLEREFGVWGLGPRGVWVKNLEQECMCMDPCARRG